MKAFIVPMLAAALLAPAASAQVTSQAAAADLNTLAPLSLSSAIARAQEHNGELRVLALEVAALEARAAQAGALPNPTLDYLREGKHEQGGAASVQLAIPLELGGKRGARVESALAELRVAAADLAAGRLRVQAEVVAAFHEAYLAERRLALSAQTSASAQQSTRSATARVAAGKISPVEETRARLAEAGVQLEAITARRDLAEARIKLALLWGGDSAELTRLAAPDLALPHPPDQRALDARLAHAPQMQRAGADLDWRSAAVRLERAKRYPDVSLIVGQKRDGPARERQAIFGLSVPLPLFDRNQGAIAEAERRVDQSRAELDAGRQRLQALAMQAAAKLAAALEQERLLREKVLPGGEHNLAAASKGFEAGKFSFLEVLDAQRTAFQAQAQHLKAMSEAHRAAADLATLIGPEPTLIPATRQQDSK